MQLSFFLNVVLEWEELRKEYRKARREKALENKVFRAFSRQIFTQVLTQVLYKVTALRLCGMLGSQHCAIFYSQFSPFEIQIPRRAQFIQQDIQGRTRDAD